MARALGLALLVCLRALVASADTVSPRVIDRTDYEQRLRGMWLATCIANWTGLRTEGARTAPPFLTDADWGQPFNGSPLTFVTGQSPWFADDDTDIEYVYLHALTESGALELTPDQLRERWQRHINRFIWVSNARARALMDRGVRPPMTSAWAANDTCLAIDAQLTTEIFGALAPGMPHVALRMADGPIRTTSAGHAQHASQFFVVLYSLATQAPPGLEDEQRVRWLYQQARRYLPDTSKAAQIADVVLADYLANPDSNDWERTRDLVHQRYQAQPAINGWQYRWWFESSVNFGAACTALLYGQGDLRRTIQIGTLSGWDSDNGTATMAGLLGLILGEQGVRAQFAGATLSGDFWASRTRDDLPNRKNPGAGVSTTAPLADDTFALIAQRMLPIVERAVQAGGGLLDIDAGRWLLPTAPVQNPLTQTPSQQLALRSANVQVRAMGGTVVATGPARGNDLASWTNLFAQGAAHDNVGLEPGAFWAHAYSSRLSPESALGPGSVQSLAVVYSQPVLAHTVRFMEGDINLGGVPGGWFESLSLQLLVNGQWITPACTPSVALDPQAPFQLIDFALVEPLLITGARVMGPVGGALGGPGYVTACEVDVLSPPITLAPIAGGFDRDANGAINAEDLYHAWQQPADTDGDGVLTARDARHIEARMRWQEAPTMRPRP